MEKRNKKVSFKIKAVNEDGTFEGYASMFGGKPDSYGDVIMPGAFTETLKRGGRNGNGIVMLWQHNSDEPIGVWESLVENTRGLRVKGRLEIESEFGKRIHSLLKMGAIKGMSIGFRLLRKEDDEDMVEEDAYEEVTKNGKRITKLKKLDLYEISLVSFPALTRATVDKVKSAVEEATTVRELERALRESGLTKKAASYLAGLCKDKLIEGVNTDDLQDINNNNEPLDNNNKYDNVEDQTPVKSDNDNDQTQSQETELKSEDEEQQTKTDNLQKELLVILSELKSLSAGIQSEL